MIVELHNVVQVQAGLLHRLGLRDSAREAVEQEAAGAVGLGDPVLHQADDHGVGHQVPGIHVRLRSQAQGVTGACRGVQWC